MIASSLVERDEHTHRRVTVEGSAAAEPGGLGSSLPVAPDDCWCEALLGAGGARTEAMGDGGQVGGRAESRQLRATGDRTTKSEADGRLFFNPATKFEALVNRSVAVAGRAAPQSISAGGVDAQKGPPSPGRCGRVSIGNGATTEGGWGEHLHCGQRQIFLGWHPGLKLSRKSAVPWLALRRPIISVPPHLPPNSTEFRFLLFSPFIFGAPADLSRTAPLPPSPSARRSAIHYFGNSTNPTNPAAKLPPTLNTAMPRPPKNKAIEPPKPVAPAPPAPAPVMIPVIPAPPASKVGPVIDVDNFIRVRDSVSSLFSHLPSEQPAPPQSSASCLNIPACARLSIQLPWLQSLVQRQQIACVCSGR